MGDTLLVGAAIGGAVVSAAALKIVDAVGRIKGNGTASRIDQIESRLRSLEDVCAELRDGMRHLSILVEGTNRDIARLCAEYSARLGVLEGRRD